MSSAALNVAHSSIGATREGIHVPTARSMLHDVGSEDAGTATSRSDEDHGGAYPSLAFVDPTLTLASARASVNGARPPALLTSRPPVVLPIVEGDPTLGDSATASGSRPNVTPPGHLPMPTPMQIAASFKGFSFAFASPAS